MVKILIFVILFSLYSCNNHNPYLMKPLDEIKLGMNEKEVNKKIDFYEKNKVIFNQNNFILNGENVSIEFYYCYDCFDNVSLEGVCIETKKSDSLLVKFKSQFKNSSYKIEKLRINIQNCCEGSQLKTKVCIFTDKMKYINSNFNLGCKFVRGDGCIKYFFQ